MRRTSTPERYVPAAGRSVFTRLYDPVMALTMRERRWRPALIGAVSDALPRGGTVIDVGAGTGAVALPLALARPDAQVVAVEADPGALAIARGKHGEQLVDWRGGMAQALPVADGRAHAVVMSLLLHHLTPDARAKAIAEGRRALRRDGLLLVADWGRPRGALARGGFALVRLLDGFEETRDHAAGRLPGLLREAGFDEPRIAMRLRTAWGTLELMTAALADGASAAR